MQEIGKGRSLPSYVIQLDVLALTTDLDQICCQLAQQKSAAGSSTGLGHVIACIFHWKTY